MIEKHKQNAAVYGLKTKTQIFMIEKQQNAGVYDIKQKV